MRSVRVFLTGGTGFIGRALVARFLGRGWQVQVLVRRPQSAEAQALQAQGASLREGDVLEPSSFAAALGETDVVVHNAGLYQFGGSTKTAAFLKAVNVEGTKQVLSSAWKAGASKILYVSSTLVFGETGNDVADETFVRRSVPQSAYEASKTEAHAFAEELQRQGAPVCIVCPGGVIGPQDHSEMGAFVRLYVRGLLPPLLIGAGGCRPHVHVEDCAEGIALAMERGRAGQTYILGGGVMGYREMFALWAETPGGLRPWGYLPRWLAVSTGVMTAPLLRMLRLPELTSGELARSAHARYQVTSEKAERELGWRPRDVRQAWLDTLEAERRLLQA